MSTAENSAEGSLEVLAKRKETYIILNVILTASVSIRVMLYIIFRTLKIQSVATIGCSAGEMITKVFQIILPNRKFASSL